MSDDLLPLSSNGRWIGRALRAFGRWLELAGIGFQYVADELQWRRWSAMRRRGH